MLHEIFYWILNMSILGSIFGLVICALRRIKRLPKFFSYLLWSVVLFRLVIPFGVSSKYSMLSLISNHLSKTLVKTVHIIEADTSETLSKLTVSNVIQVANTYHPITYKFQRLESFFEISALVWIIIGSAAVLATLIMYGMAIAELKKATHLQDNIYQGNMVTTPTVVGIIKPKIILPQGMDAEHLEHILAHEKVHIKRMDNIWRMLAIITACIHWFNPLVWMFLRSFLRDCELACDEGAIKNMDQKERKAYANTLIHYSREDRTVFTSAFGSSKVKVRVKSILSYQKLSILSLVCMTGMLLILMILMLTNAKP